ncbi:MAG TPA: hypothetical protein VIU65_05035 [Pyrinomonadaceae bacterium]
MWFPYIILSEVLSSPWRGAAIDQIGRTYSLRLKDAEYKQMLREGFVYYITVPIKRPGAYQYVLQVMVTDALADKKHQAVSQWMDFQIVD